MQTEFREFAVFTIKCKGNRRAERTGESFEVFTIKYKENRRAERAGEKTEVVTIKYNGIRTPCTLQCRPTAKGMSTRKSCPGTGQGRLQSNCPGSGSCWRKDRDPVPSSNPDSLLKHNFLDFLDTNMGPES